MSESDGYLSPIVIRPGSFSCKDLLNLRIFELVSLPPPECKLEGSNVRKKCPMNLLVLRSKLILAFECKPKISGLSLNGNVLMNLCTESISSVSGMQ